MDESGGSCLGLVLGEVVREGSANSKFGKDFQRGTIFLKANFIPFFAFLS